MLKEIYTYKINFLKRVFIIDEYEIDTDADLIKQTELFILRYRRIIGIILLIILLYILIECPSLPGTRIHHQMKGGAGALANMAQQASASMPAAQNMKSIKATNIKQKFNSMRQAGFSRLDSTTGTAYNLGAAAGNKAKEFAGWLYQIVFAIAISIAICLIILPSLSFFIIGIICYFLLRNKIKSLKSQ